jgi:hypothetical protein
MPAEAEQPRVGFPSAASLPSAARQLGGLRLHTGDDLTPRVKPGPG